MIDKLEVVVPNKADFSPEFSHIFSETRGAPGDPFRRGQRYTVTADLRQFGIGAVVHLWSTQGKVARHKVELLETGKMSLREMEHEVTRIFDTDPAKLEVRRMDAAADVDNLPMDFFHQRVRVMYKQWAAKIGKDHLAPGPLRGPTEIEYSEMGKRELQTLYYGKRPNCLRIYNKTAEYRHQYKYFLRDVEPGPDLPTFEDLYGITESQVRTRVERQMHGDKLPLQLNTISRLRANVLEFDPFARMKFIQGGKPEPNPDSYDLETWAAGMFWRQQWEERGAQWVYSMMNRERNGARMLRRFKDFLPKDPNAEQTAMDLGDRPAEQQTFIGMENFDARKLTELYRASTERQLAA